MSEISELNYYYNTLKKISDSGEIFKNHFYNNLESFRSQLKSIDNQIFINIFVKKVIEIFIDLLFNIPDIKEAASQTKLKAVISFARRMKFVPYLGILSLIVDIVMILIEIRQEKEEIHEIINDCALLESFYSNLSNEVSCIMSGGIVNYDQLCELKNDRVYLYNALSVYRKNHNNIYCNPISLYMTILIHKNKSWTCNVDSFAQISQSNTNSLTSSYFNHVKNLLLLANQFTFIQTANYSSSLINEILKDSHMNHPKYSVIISNSQDINNFIYRSQQHIFQELRSNSYYSSNMVFFRCLHKESIKNYTTVYLRNLLNIIKDVDYYYKILRSNVKKEYKNIFNNINKYFLESIYGFDLEFIRIPYFLERSPLEALKLFFEIDSKYSNSCLLDAYYLPIDDIFFINGNEYITKEYILYICDKYKCNTEKANKKYKGDIERFLDDIFAKSIFASRENYNKFLKRPTAKALLNDPMILFAQSVENERENLSNSLKSYDAAYNRAHRTYVKGLLEMEKDKKHWPDANFTLRLTYGQVKGYHPRDCVYYTHQTTLDGVMEKEDSTNWEFVVPQKLKDLYRAKDFGRYATKDGRMPVAFCATTHTTGGNSGSPVMNANGELIGINFDRNWEGVGGDIEYLPDYQRSIIVDIRYVLFLIEKYGGAEGLLQEMEIIE